MLSGLYVFINPFLRNTVVPTQKSKIFTTEVNNQPSVHIKIYQGERELTKHNMKLGGFVLGGIPPAPRGVPQVGSLNLSGMLNF